MTDDDKNIQPAELNQSIHNIRGALNRITMHAEVAKLALNGDIPIQKGTDSLQKVIENAKSCSDLLKKLAQD